MAKDYRIAKDKFDKEFRGITFRQLLDESHHSGKLKGEVRILKEILFKILNLKEGVDFR